MEIKEISNPKDKFVVCNDILRALPSWFGIEESIVDYVKAVEALPFYAAYISEKPVGFIAIKVHNDYTAEVYVMGVLQAYHRQGIGRKLITDCEDYCKSNKFEFLTVKTLDESRECEDYAKTRSFYLGMGFKPLEVFPLLWDESNPCLFMAKYVGEK